MDVGSRDLGGAMTEVAKKQLAVRLTGCRRFFAG
jgi:hypothetical protein